MVFYKISVLRGLLAMLTGALPRRLRRHALFLLAFSYVAGQTARDLAAEYRRILEEAREDG